MAYYENEKVLKKEISVNDVLLLIDDFIFLSFYRRFAYGKRPSRV